MKKSPEELVTELNGRRLRAIEIARSGELGDLVQTQLKELGFVQGNEQITQEMVAGMLAHPTMRSKIYDLIEQSGVTSMKDVDMGSIVNFDDNADQVKNETDSTKKTKRTEALNALKGLLRNHANGLENISSKAASQVIDAEHRAIDSGFQKYLREQKDKNLAAVFQRWNDVSYDSEGKATVDKKTPRENLREDLTTILRFPDGDLGLKIIIARSQGLIKHSEYPSIDKLREACGMNFQAVESTYAEHASKIKGTMFQRFINLRSMSDAGLFNTFLTGGEKGLFFNRRGLEGLATYFGDVPEEYLMKNPEAQNLLKRIDKSTMENMTRWQKFGLLLLLGLIVAGGAGMATGAVASSALAGTAAGIGAAGIEGAIGATARRVHVEQNP